MLYVILPTITLVIIILIGGKINNLNASKTSYNEKTVSEQAISEKKDEFSDLDISKAPDIEKITEEQFDKFSTKDIRLIVAAYITDYRKTYKIPKDYKMEEKDWKSIKRIMKYQIFSK